MARITHNGSSGSVTLIGDPNNENVFEGVGGGGDFLVGGHLNDTFYLTTDRTTDFVDGGAGRDLVDFSWAGPLRIDLGAGVAQQYLDMGLQDISGHYDNGAIYSWHEVAILANIEDVRGTAFNDSIIGSWADNTIEGGYGADAINGAGGNDTASYEHSFAGVTVDLGGWSPFNGALGPVGSGSGGDAEGDVLISIENVTGSYYGDRFSGNAADNIFNGGGGLDRVSYRNADEGVAIDLATGSVQGGASVGTDTLVSIEYVEGSRYDDTYVASDRQDVFVFGPDIGHDTIDGFDAGDGANHDYIAFEGLFSDYDDLECRMEQDGTTWTITIDEHNSITLTNVQGTLDVADFFH
jgi:hypothetical protein